MKKIHIVDASVAIALVLSLVVSCIGFGKDCADIRSNIVRLHILANSDSDADQQIKLSVRDAFLNCGMDFFGGVVNVDNAQEILNNNKESLISLADSVLRENGFDYKTQIYLTEEYFTTRSYEEITGR